MNMLTGSKSLLKSQISLKDHTTMKVGGPADYFAEPRSEEELLDAVAWAKEKSLPFVVMGKGSNLIFADEGYRGLVISMTHYCEDRIHWDEETQILDVSAGISLHRISLYCRDNGIGGFEFLSGIPGTIGGAVCMNAGFSRYPGQINEISDLLASVTLIREPGEKVEIKRSEVEFGYRSSNLPGQIILGARFRLWRRDQGDIEKEIRANFEYRSSRQDLTRPSSGSIFKNPKGLSVTAGVLIEKAGLKGFRIGGAAVSERHANYILNVDQATSHNIMELIQVIQKTVYEKFQTWLEPEVRIIEKS